MIENINLDKSQVSAELHGYMYDAIHGKSGVFDYGNKLAYELVSNNEIKIKDGLILNRGRFMRVVGAESLSIANGVSGTRRYDLIVAHFETDGINETHDIRVIKGETDGQLPATTQEDIYNGGAIYELPLYSVFINGLNVETITPLFDILISFDKLKNTKLSIFNNAGFKNSIFRGQYLGTSITTEQYNSIANGSFEDLYLGDYWNIGGHNWRIWGFNTFLRDGDSECTSPHILLMPDDNYLKANGSDTRYMKDSNDTSGGYKATKFFTTYANQIYNELTAYFGSHILSHRELISNASSNGKDFGWDWASVPVGIPTEINIYGSSGWGASEIAGTGYNIGVNKTVFPLAVVEPSLITNREDWWLRDVVSASNFASVDFDGRADSAGASASWLGVRPYILIS